MRRPSRSGVTNERVKLRGTYLATRRTALTQMALLGLLALAGCAGGGGGGAAGNVVPALGYTYPSSLTNATSSNYVGGSMAPYALDPTTPQLDSLTPSVLAASPAAGQLTLVISGMSFSGGTEPAFQVTFDSTTTGSALLNSPLDGIGCSSCLETATAQATYVSSGTSAGTVSITYLDPNSPNFPLSYSALGIWTMPSGGTISSSWPNIGGAFSAGVLTRGIDLPTTGTATYNGYFIGTYVNSDVSSGIATGTYLAGAKANAQVDFSADSGEGAITSFTTSNTYISQELSSGKLATPVPEPNLDLSTTTPMIIQRTVTSNSFHGGAGTLTNKMGMGTNGDINGAFYGPPASTAPYAPPEMGGSLGISNSGNTQNMAGSFALKQ